MRRFLALVCALLPLTSVSDAEPPKNTSLTHASRESAIELLRHEGILHGKTTVVSAQWSGNMWFISLRHPSGTVSNWTVDSTGQDYSYVCRH
jgi:hypothetical protein